MSELLWHGHPNSRNEARMTEMTSLNDKIAAVVARTDLSNPQSVIGARIIILALNHSNAVGGSLADSTPWAIDQVLGAGAYAAQAAELYYALRAAA